MQNITQSFFFFFFNPAHLALSGALKLGLVQKYIFFFLMKNKKPTQDKIDLLEWFPLPLFLQVADVDKR